MNLRREAAGDPPLANEGKPGHWILVEVRG
jgi:hypothetical protein